LIKLIKRILIENLGWKVLSVALAFLLWAAVASEPELATSISVPILFRNIPDDMDISSEVLERVHLEIRGPARRLTPESLAQTAVVLNLSDVQPGERTFTIHDRDVRQLPIGVVFYRAVPSQVGLRFERLLSRDVPIQPVYSKPPPDGYRIVSYWFSPAKVRVRGPEGHVQPIHNVMSDPIDLSGVVSKKEVRVQVRVGDPQVRLEAAPVVTYSVEMTKVRR
jgi:YbbR domain-containing protein